MRDDLAGDPGADRGTDAVGHQHEEPLRTGLHGLCGLLLDKECTGDVEEVKRHAVDDAGEEEQDDAHDALRGADSEEAEAQHPGEHGHQHDDLDAEALEAERDQQNTQRLGDLRDGDQQGRVFGKPAFGRRGKAVDIGGGISVRDLQRHAQQHREEEKEGHLALLKQHEGIQTEALGEGFLPGGGRTVDGARRKAEGIEPEHQAEDSADDQLHVGELRGHGDEFEHLHSVAEFGLNARTAETDEVDEPHGGDKADGAEDTDRREVPDGIESAVFQNREGHGIREGDRRHVEGHAQAVGRKDRADGGRLTGEGQFRGLETEPGGHQHEDGGCEVRDAEQPLRFDELVGNGSDDRGHEDRDNPLRDIKPGDILSQPHAAEEIADTDKIGSPNGELEKVHDDETRLDSHKSLF